MVFMVLGFTSIGLAIMFEPSVFNDFLDYSILRLTRVIKSSGSYFLGYFLGFSSLASLVFLALGFSVFLSN